MTAADDLAFAHELADLARPLARRWFRTDLAVERKPDDSPVTHADRAIERALRERIAEQRPDDGILGEEHGRENLDRDRVWVVDPIDGTRSFVTGSPLFGTLVALARGGRPVLGVIEVPVLAERFAGRAGEPSHLGDRPLRTRGCRRLEDAYLATAPPSSQPSVHGAADALAARTAARRWGGDCYMYAQLALGCLDLVLEAELEPYDFAALVPVVQGAGGVISDWSGAPLTMSSAGDVLAAATPELHAEALAVLHG